MANLPKHKQQRIEPTTSLDARDPMNRDDGYAAENSLRRAGLPFFVSPRARHRRLLQRTGPLFTFLAVIDLLSQSLNVITFEDIDTDGGVVSWAEPLIILSVWFLAVITVGATMGIIARRVIERRSRRALPWGASALFVYVIGCPISTAVFSGGNAVDHVGVNACGALIVLLAAWSGVGAILVWALRTASRQLRSLGTLATRALPVLILVVMFSFFSKALWDVTSTMTLTRMAAFVVLFIFVGLLFCLPLAHKEAAAVVPDRNHQVPSLSTMERINLVAMMVVTIGFEVFLYSTLVFCFLLVLGSIAFSPHVLTSWLGTGYPLLEIVLINTPFPVALVNTSLVVSAISALNFLITATTTASYRALFLEPLLVDVRAAIAARTDYLTR